MKTVYLLIGLPGSGKSTFANTILKDTKIVELDAIRQQLANDGVIGKTYSTADNECVFKHFHNAILNAIKQYDSVVVDSTNARLSDRQDIYNLLKEFKPKYVVVKFLDDKQTVLKRIEKRQAGNKNLVHYFENPKEAIEIYAKRIEEGNATFSEPIAEIWEVKDGHIMDKQQKILIASTNIGKIGIYAQIFDEFGIPYTSLAEIKIDEIVEETGKDETENAVLKAKAYHQITGLPVISNDSGLIIDRFKPEDQPGVLVRRFKGHELSDIDLLNLYISKLNEVGGESYGHYNVALAVIDKEGKLHSGTFKPARHFINKPSKTLKKGLPLASLSYDDESGRYESEMTMKERNLFEKEAMQQQKQFIEKFFKIKNSSNK